VDLARGRVDCGPGYKGAGPVGAPFDMQNVSQAPTVLEYEDGSKREVVIPPTNVKDYFAALRKRMEADRSAMFQVVPTGEEDYKHYELKKITFPMGLLEINGLTASGTVEEVVFSPTIMRMTGMEFPLLHSLTRVKLSRSLGVIPENAFIRCKHLVEINLEHVLEIGPNAFSHCVSLTKAIMSRAVEIKETAFLDCIKLREIVAPRVEIIGASAFEGCELLEEVRMPLVRTISEAAFANCVKLKSVHFPAAQTIEKQAFDETVLVDLDFPSVTTISNDSFSFVATIKTVNLQNIASVPEALFYFKEKLERVDIPTALSIEQSAFDTCNGLKTVNAPLVREVGELAFRSCRSLEQITLESVSLLKFGAFRSCSNLKRIEMPSIFDITWEAFSGCKSLHTIVGTPQYLGVEAFLGCTSLETFPSSNVKIFSKNCFKDCYSLKNIEVQKDVVAVDGLWFDGRRPKELTLTVWADSFTTGLNHRPVVADFHKCADRALHLRIILSEEEADAMTENPKDAEARLPIWESFTERFGRATRTITYLREDRSSVYQRIVQDRDKRAVYAVMKLFESFGLPGDISTSIMGETSLISNEKGVRGAANSVYSYLQGDEERQKLERDFQLTPDEERTIAENAEKAAAKHAADVAEAAARRSRPGIKHPADDEAAGLVKRLRESAREAKRPVDADAAGPAKRPREFPPGFLLSEIPTSIFIRA